jgi:hypothetical protein
MVFRAQIYCLGEDRRPSLIDPQDLTAATHKEAAEAICGKGLIEAGHPHNLAVKVWTSGRNQPDIKLFYRA